MSDKDNHIAPAASVANHKPANGLQSKPLYLVIVEEPPKKSPIFYVAVKVDKQEHSVELRGHVTLEDTETLRKDPHKYFDSSKMEELCFPWRRIVKIQNLSFTPKKN